jgi:hypothetical protein
MGQRNWCINYRLTWYSPPEWGMTLTDVHYDQYMTYFEGRCTGTVLPVSICCHIEWTLTMLDWWSHHCLPTLKASLREESEKTPNDSLSLKTTSTSVLPSLEGLRRATAPSCLLSTYLAKADYVCILSPQQISYKTLTNLNHVCPIQAVNAIHAEDATLSWHHQLVWDP